MGFFDDAISSIGKSLAQSTVTYLNDQTGYDVGGTLSYLFGNGQENKGDTLAQVESDLQQDFSGSAAQLDLLTSGVANIQNELTDIGSQLNGLANAVQQLNAQYQQIENELNKIQQEQLYLSWQAQDNEIKTYTLRIQQAYVQYADYVALDASVKTVGDFVTQVLDPNIGEAEAASAINGFMLTSGSNKGALQLWAEMVAPIIEGGQLDYRQAVDEYISYYSALVWSQLQATNLVIEAYHFNGEPDLAAQAWSEYLTTIRSQENEFISNLVAIVRSGFQGGLNMIAGTTAPYFCWVPNSYAGMAAQQLHPDYLGFGVGPEGGAYWTLTSAYCERSSIFLRAEALLANLALADPSSRRIVVHMVHFGGAFKTAIDAATITIQNTGSQQAQPIPPSQDPALFGPFNSPTLGAPTWAGNPIDSMWVTSPTFYVKRLVYETSGEQSTAIADGVYQLSDLNGSGSLQPMQTYDGPNQPFQSDSVLGYSIQVNAAQQFDFMNFSAYFGSWGVGAAAPTVSSGVLGRG